MGPTGAASALAHSFAELREVASEECPTGIGELGVQPASILEYAIGVGILYIDVTLKQPPPCT